MTKSISALQKNLFEVAKAFLPPPDLTVSQWADANRQLSSVSSAEPGKWNTARAEYQREIMDVGNDPLIETVVVMTSGQVGKTEVLLNVTGYHIDRDPAPILIVQPTLDMGKAFSTDRLSKMIELTPGLQGKVSNPKSRDSGNTLFHKEFAGGHITISGANSPASLASRPIRILLCDEVDRYPVSAGTEGDPVFLGRKRTTTFWNRKIYLISTPTVKGASRIETAYNLSDKRVFMVPCPHCGTKQRLKWGGKDEVFGIKWDIEDGKPVNIGYMCEGCGVLLQEHEKGRMIREGEWMATAPGGSIAGFHISELYSPWSTWENVVIQFLESKGSPELLQTWINMVLGETYEEKGEGIQAHQLQDRQENFDPTFLPDGVLVITAGVDVQDDRLEMEIVGWGIGEESWSLEYLVLNGDTSRPEVWNRLDEERAARFNHRRYGKLPISISFVDSSYITDVVYRYCDKRRGVKPVQGLTSQRGKAKPIVEPREKATKKGGYVPVGVDTAKDVIYARLRFAKPGPGYCHFPEHYQPDYFSQLTAEEKRTKFVQNRQVKYWFLPKGKRNEALDCRVYAFAALRFLQIKFERVKARLELGNTPQQSSGRRVRSGGVV